MFETILCRAYPDLEFERAGSPERSGLLGERRTIPVRGLMTATSALETEIFLSLISNVLTIEDSLDESHALAYHQDEDEWDGLSRSRMGTLVYKAKWRHSGAIAATGLILGTLRAFIAGHPRYQPADFIAAVPSHVAGSRVSLSESIADQLAVDVGMTRLVIHRVDTRQPQKEIIDEDRRAGVKRRFANQRDSMRVNEDINGRAVILIDDLYGSGGTMAEAARAAREAGAVEALGLTMTKQRLYEGVRLATRD